LLGYAPVGDTDWVWLSGPLRSTLTRPASSRPAPSLFLRLEYREHIDSSFRTRMHDCSSTSSTREDRRVRANRADLGFGSIMAERLYSTRRKVFGWRNWWMGRTYEHLWPLANTWSAFCTLASLPERDGVRVVLPLLLDTLPAYHRDGAAVLTGRGPIGFESAVVPPLGRGGDTYFDDNAWLGLALMRHQEICHDDISLRLAERLFRFIVTGWSADDEWALPGGIRWKANPSSTSRNTCANGPAATLGALLHQLTGDPTTLEWAVRIYRWTRAALLRDDDLYADRIDPDGTVIPDLWTYNQGCMVGAGVLLAEATGDPMFLADARSTAMVALERFVLDDLVRNGAAFNAVYFRNLFLLPSGSASDTSSSPGSRPPNTGTLDGDEVGAPAAPGWTLAGAYDDLLWEERDRRTGLFPGSGSPLNRMGPLVQIEALLAGAAPYP
jgi:hypothetical protein